ncbi:MAG: nucleotidyl transferase AbiEii/AbiGii toxin family protein [Deltaproteobacteria bacterium]|nr:nucleotidyl transferase AbiEii/AbiGii toxin family protein [Deltaproteobacteria bacterium]
MANSSTLANRQLLTLDRLTRLLSLNGFYLAGDTAVAYYLNHRVSRDLDIFSSPKCADLEQVHREIVSKLDDVEIISITDVSIHLKTEQSPVDIVRYPYPLLEQPTVGPHGFSVASLVDLAAMKLAAIAKRGIKRDFWDLYEILSRTEMSLDQCFKSYKKKFGKHESNFYSVLRSLTYFEDTEAETVFPVGMSPKLFDMVKDYFKDHAPKMEDE